MSKRKNSGPLFFKPKRAPVQKNPQSDIVVSVERLSAEGRGMAFHANKPVFIAGAVPGEVVRARITLDKREYAEAELCDIIEPAAHRIMPRCELFGRCGGCALQMLSIEDQIQHKADTLQRLLSPHIAALEAPILAAPWHYRHRARFSVAEKDGVPIIGFKAANSHRVISVAECAILDTRLQPLLTAIPQWLQRLTHWQRIEEFRVAIDGEGKIGVQWSARQTLTAHDIAILNAACAEAGASSNTGISSDALMYHVASQQTAFKFAVNDFTQVNPAINDQLVDHVLTWLAPQRDEVIADYFCGLGNFSLPLAKYAKSVIGYEADAQMVARATENALGLSNLEFRAADLYAHDAAVIDIFDAVVLDPPRAGAKALCERLAKTKKLQRIVYVSCNPQTLIRDIDILARAGFRLQHAALVDMFPQTGHIEAVVKLQRS